VTSPAAAVPSSHGGKPTSGFLTPLIEKPPDGGFLIDGRRTQCYDPLDRRLRTPRPTRRWGDAPKSENEGNGGEKKVSRPLEREAQMWKNSLNLCRSWVNDEEGASLVEYVLMVALIAVVCIAAVTLLGTAAKGKFETTANAIKG